jgi:hypothetical protein
LWFIAASVVTSMVAVWSTRIVAEATRRDVTADRLLAQYPWGKQAYTLGVAPLAADPLLWSHDPVANRWYVLTASEAERRRLPRSGLELGRGVGGGVLVGYDGIRDGMVAVEDGVPVVVYPTRGMALYEWSPDGTRIVCAARPRIADGGVTDSFQLRATDGRALRVSGTELVLDDPSRATAFSPYALPSIRERWECETSRVFCRHPPRSNCSLSPKR